MNSHDFAFTTRLFELFGAISSLSSQSILLLLLLPPLESQFSLSQWLILSAGKNFDRFLFCASQLRLVNEARVGNLTCLGSF